MNEKAALLNDKVEQISTLLAERQHDKDEAYKLAVLAALLCPELCRTKPIDALNAAEKLLLDALMHLKMGKAEGKRTANALEQMWGSQDRELAQSIAYNKAVNFITRENLKKNPHPGRAKEEFVKFWSCKNNIIEREAKKQLREYEQGRKSFTLRDALQLGNEHAAWKSQPKKSKGKQGKVKNPEKDARKRAHPTPMPGLRRLF